MSNTNFHSQQQEKQELSFLISPYFTEEEAVSHFMQLMKDPKTGRSNVNRHSARQVILQVKTAFRREQARVKRMIEKEQFQEVYQMEFKYINYQFKTLQEFKELRNRWIAENPSETEGLPPIEIPSFEALKELSRQRKVSFANRYMWEVESRLRFVDGDYVVA